MFQVRSGHLSPIKSIKEEDHKRKAEKGDLFMWPYWKCKGTRGARQVLEGGSKFKWRPKDMHVEVALV